MKGQNPWYWLFLVAALEAGAAIAIMLMVPREGGSISLARGAVLTFLAGATIGSLFMARRSASLPAPRLGPAARILAVATLTASSIALFLLRFLDPALLMPFYERLSIPLWFVWLISVQILGLVLYEQYGFSRERLWAWSTILRPTAVVLGVLLVIWAVIVFSGLGITPDAAYWGEPGVPVFGWQLALSLVGGLVLLVLPGRLRNWSRLDTFAALGLWLVAAVVWLSVPIETLQNSFYAPIRPPSGQPFPNSDAGYYDSMAQSLLIGYPYQGDIPSRPLYIVFLTLLHLLFGERYHLIIAGQTLMLALIPVVIFHLGRELHSREAGVIAALFAIAREWNTLLVSSETRVSNSKTLLVDLPTMLVLLVTCFLVARWLKSDRGRDAALAGGMFGLLLLLRTQALVLLPVIFLLRFLSDHTDPRNVLLHGGTFLGVMVAAIFPWLLHNFVISGQLTFDAPFQYRIIASQYQYSGNLDIGAIDLEGKSLLGILLTFALRDPGFVAGFIANHAMANQIGALLVLPLVHSFNGLLAEINLYWLAWNGTLTWPNVLLLVFYLAMIALGLVSSWRRGRWAGLAPLGFSFGYSLANGIARFSGWRYDLPADWVAYFYFAFGAAELLLLFRSILSGRTHPQGEKTLDKSRPAGWRQSRLPVLGLFFLVGALPWMAETIAAPRYADATASKLVVQLSEAESIHSLGITPADIRQAAQSPAAVLEMGRLLYPRFFTRENGLASAHPWPAYAPREYPRVGFLLLNNRRTDVVLPLREPPPALSHGEDVIVLGCDLGDRVEARLAYLPTSGLVFRAEPSNPLSCK